MAKESQDKKAEELSPQELLKNFLKENNLSLELSRPNIRYVDDGSIILSASSIIINKNA